VRRKSFINSASDKLQHRQASGGGWETKRFGPFPGPLGRCGICLRLKTHKRLPATSSKSGSAASSWSGLHQVEKPVINRVFPFMPGRVEFIHGYGVPMVGGGVGVLVDSDDKGAAMLAGNSGGFLVGGKHFHRVISFCGYR